MNTKIEWISKKVKVADIKPTPKNYKIKTDLGKARLQNSLKQFGLAGTIIVNTDLTIIDGNSRWQEAVDNKIKIVEVSMPKKKLTPKLFKEMSAMLDFAKAGEVDIEEIERDLGTTSDFFNKWGMEPPMEMLAKKGKQDDLDLEEFEYPSEGGDKAAPQISDIRMIQLFLSAKQEERFREIETELSSKFKTNNTTDTVMAALESLVPKKAVKKVAKRKK